VEDLTEGTLADLQTLMHHPPRLRRGHTADSLIPTPAPGGGYTYKIGASYWERIVALAFLLTTGAAAGARSLAINYAQGDAVIFDASPVAAGIGPSQTCQVYADLDGTPAVSPAPTQAITQSFAGGAGATVTLPAGATLLGYTVTAASTAAAENGTVTVSNVPGGPLVYAFTMPNGGNGAPFQNIPFPGGLAPVGGAITVVLSAITSGSAGDLTAYYQMGGSATASTAYPQLPDITMKSGWQVQLAVAGVQAADQLSNIIIINEQYPSNWADGALGSDEEREWRRVLEQLRQGA
jgi:hypothetical protein